MERYDKLTAELYQGVPKSIAGVEENTATEPDYLLE